MKNIQGDRLGQIDAAKGLLLILVIYGHIYLAAPADNNIACEIFHWICVFHVPAFFCISGALFNADKWHDKGIIKFLKNRIYSILIPLCFFEMLNAVINHFVFNVPGNMKGLIYEALCGNFSAGADWFLEAFLITELFLFFITYIPSKGMMIIITLGIGVLMNYLPHFVLLINVYRGLIGFGFAVLGYMGKKYILTQEKRGILIIIPSFLITVSIQILNGNVDMYSLVLNRLYLFFMGAIAGTIFIIEICKYVNCIGLQKIGRNSLIILGTHQVFIKVIQRTNIAGLKGILFGIASSILIIIGEMVLIILLNKYIPFLVGNKKFLESR